MAQVYPLSLSMHSSPLERARCRRAMCFVYWTARDCLTSCSAVKIEHPKPQVRMCVCVHVWGVGVGVGGCGWVWVWVWVGVGVGVGVGAHVCMCMHDTASIQITFSEEELRQRLSDQEYHVTQERGTERYRNIPCVGTFPLYG